jgi:hypothetical protein
MPTLQSLPPTVPCLEFGPSTVLVCAAQCHALKIRQEAYPNIVSFDPRTAGLVADPTSCVTPGMVIHCQIGPAALHRTSSCPAYHS